MITRSIQAARQEGSVAMSENLPSCVPKDMGRRSAVSA
jgi:hypothetical protein